MSLEFVEVAKTLAASAASRLMELRSQPIQKERKADHSWVTNADRAADEIIRTGLRKAFPTHAILTEESSLEGNAGAEFVWVVDPLDGTKAYLNGRAGFSVMIGLLRHGKPYAGVVADPLEGHLYEAIRGGGAFHTLQGRRVAVHVSSRSEWTEMPLVTSTDFPEKLVQPIKAVLTSPWIPAINSVGIKIGLVVRQVADLYLNHHPVHYWDSCAPQAILEEAGGIYTFIDGQPLLYDLASDYRHRKPSLASNGTRHQEFVERMEKVFAQHHEN